MFRDTRGGNLLDKEIIRLEYLSDQIRKGIPVDFSEAIEVIEYQESLKEKRKSSGWNKLLNWLRRQLVGQGNSSKGCIRI